MNDYVTAREAARLLGLDTPGGARSTLSKNGVRAVERDDSRYARALYRRADVERIVARRRREPADDREAA